MAPGPRTDRKRDTVTGVSSFHLTLLARDLEGYRNLVKLSTRATADDLKGFHHVIVATGIVPRQPAIVGLDHPSVASYVDVVSGRREPGRLVAIVGAGGIGFDVAELLSSGNAPDGHASDGRIDDPAIALFRQEWGIDAEYRERGGVRSPEDPQPSRKLWLLQRKASKVGEGLAKTTGWIRRTLLKRRGVMMVGGVEYVKIDDEGLHVLVDGKPQLIPADTIVICAGQEPRRELVDALSAVGVPFTLVGGADVAAELDAKRAIEQGTRVALAL
jgi:2,4-dienoyl-CoA reductase (NADPH2)